MAIGPLAMSKGLHSHGAIHGLRHWRPILRSTESTPTLPELEPPTLVRRKPNSTDGFGQSSTSCTGPSCNDLPTSNTDETTLPITLGVIIPIVCAFVLFFYFWMRHRKKEKFEDAHDRNASLDFGLGEPRRTKKKGKGMEMSANNSAQSMLRQERGMSMDLGNPYVLPGELADSRPSFHSLSRSQHDGEDPYRPAELVMSSSRSLQGSRPSSRRDNASEFSEGSTFMSPSSKPLLSFTSPLQPQTSPPNSMKPFRKQVPGDTSERDIISSPTSQVTSTPSVSRKPLALPKDEPVPRKSLDHHHAMSPVELSSLDNARRSVEAPQRHMLPTFDFDNRPAELGAQELPAYQPGAYEPKAGIQRKEISQPDRLPERKDSMHVVEPTIPSRGDSIPQRGDSLARTDFSSQRDALSSPPVTIHEPNDGYGVQPDDDYETYADVLGIVQEPTNDPVYDEQPGNHLGHLSASGFNEYDRPLSATFRPLPPDEVIDNPEQRANRIRSFYKEYFEEKNDSRRTYQGGNADYHEDYDQEFLNGATVWDPQSGQFVLYHGQTPWADPIGRRAMTPPPRMPPRNFNGHSATSSRQYNGRGPRGQRAYSSASNPAMGYGQRPPRRPALPPTALTNLPTPHLLKDDAAIFNATDFAPPSSYRERVQGRPESPFREKRPYSPTVRPFTPLASPYHELNAMPSPHLLRRSGTFTALDFAPPPRYKGGDNGSDSGSIRSGRSNYSNVQLSSLRNGAYRVSRIPKEMVGTKADFAAALRPSWAQRD